MMSSEVKCEDVSNVDTSETDLLSFKNNEVPTASNGGKSGNHSKKRDNHPHHRRKPSKKKRKWKPYSKMTWEEKKAAEEREKLRALRIRGEMMDKGRPVAPYNTTQFIMAEHDPYDGGSVLDSVENSKSSASEECSAILQGTDSPSNLDERIEAEYNDSPHMAPEFISQDFSEAYERVQEESLSTMSRNDLVQEHISLERTLSYLQDKLAQEKSINNSYSIKVESFEEELERLRKDNQRLVQENMVLKYGEEAIGQESNENGIFETSDCDYEAPTSENENVIYKSSDENSDIENFSLGSEVNNVRNNSDGECEDCMSSDASDAIPSSPMLSASVDSSSSSVGSCSEEVNEGLAKQEHMDAEEQNATDRSVAEASEITEGKSTDDSHDNSIIAPLSLPDSEAIEEAEDSYPKQ